MSLSKWNFLERIMLHVSQCVMLGQNVAAALHAFPVYANMPFRVDGVLIRAHGHLGGDTRVRDCIPE